MAVGSVNSSYAFYPPQNAGAGAGKSVTRADFRDIINNHIDEMEEKIKRGDVQQKFTIGSQEMTLEEWDELLERFDEAEKAIIQEAEAQAAENIQEDNNDIT